MKESMSTNRDYKKTRQFLGVSICALAFLMTHIPSEFGTVTKYDLQRGESILRKATITRPITPVNLTEDGTPPVQDVLDSTLQRTNITHTFEDATDYTLQQSDVTHTIENVTDHTLLRSNITHTVKKVRDQTLQRLNVSHSIEKVTDKTQLRTNVAHSVEKVADHTLKQKTKKKYLLYFSQSGFANQMICLTHAYMMARTLNRVLLLPPILPHHPYEGGFSPFFVINSQTHEFPTAKHMKYMKPASKNDWIPSTYISKHWILVYTSLLVTFLILILHRRVSSQWTSENFTTKCTNLIHPV